MPDLPNHYDPIEYADQQAKLAQAQRLIEEVNAAESHDATLNWRPWRIARPFDPRY